MAKDIYVLKIDNSQVLELTYSKGNLTNINLLDASDSLKALALWGASWLCHNDNDFAAYKALYEKRDESISFIKKEKKGSESLASQIENLYKDHYNSLSSGLIYAPNYSLDRKNFNRIAEILTVNNYTIDDLQLIFTNWHKLPNYYKNRFKPNEIAYDLVNIIKILREKYATNNPNTTAKSVRDML